MKKLIEELEQLVEGIELDEAKAYKGLTVRPGRKKGEYEVLNEYNTEVGILVKTPKGFEVKALPPGWRTPERVKGAFSSEKKAMDALLKYLERKEDVDEIDEAGNLEERKFPPKAMNVNKIKDADGFWEWDIDEAKKYSGHSGNLSKGNMGDIIFFLNLAGAAWERNSKARSESVIDEARRPKEKDVSNTYYKYFDGIQVNMMDIPKLYKEIEKLLVAGDDIEDGMKGLVKKYRV